MNWLLHHDDMSHNLITFPLPLYSPDLASCDFSLFPRLRIQLKGHNFDTVDVIEAVLNTVTEHDFQDAFKKWQKCWEWCIRAGGQ
jgi:hypothetical protein